MHDVKLTPKSLESIQAVSDYIAFDLHNPQAADKLIDKVNSTIAEICVFPYGYEPFVTFHNEEYRAVYIGNFVLFYHMHKDLVIIDSLQYAQKSKKNLIRDL